MTTRAIALGASLLAAAAGAVLARDPAPGDERAIAGRLVDEYGHPLARWNVSLLPVPEWMPSTPHGVTDADGRFRLPANPRILHRVQVAPADTWPGPPITGPLRAGTTDLELAVKPDLMRHARVHCRIVSPDGDSLPGVSAFLQSTGGGSAVFDFEATGAAVSRRVEPGVYSICASDSVCGWYEFGAVEVKDAADVDAGTLRFPRLGLVRLEPEVPAPADRPRVVYHVLGLLSERTRRWFGGTRNYGMGRQGELIGGCPVDCAVTPGRYLVRADGPGVQGIERTVDVRSGETTIVPLHVAASPVRRLSLRFPDALPSMIRVELREATGDATWEAVIGAAADPQVRLAPGAYRVEVEADDLRRYSAALVVPDDPDARIDVRLTSVSAAPARPR